MDDGPSSIVWPSGGASFSAPMARRPPAPTFCSTDGVGQLAAAEVGDAAGRRVHRAAGRKADEDAWRLALGAGDRRQGERQGRE
jgi:hypothetical protein